MVDLVSPLMSIFFRIGLRMPSAGVCGWLTLAASSEDINTAETGGACKSKRVQSITAAESSSLIYNNTISTRNNFSMYRSLNYQLGYLIYLIYNGSDAGYISSSNSLSNLSTVNNFLYLSNFSAQRQTRLANSVCRQENNTSIHAEEAAPARSANSSHNSFT